MGKSYLKNGPVLHKNTNGGIPKLGIQFVEVPIKGIIIHWAYKILSGP